MTADGSADVARHPGAVAEAGPEGWYQCDALDPEWTATHPTPLVVDEVPDWPRCHRWWPSLASLHRCPHTSDDQGLADTDEPEVVYTQVPNRLPGKCFRCGQVVPAQRGRLVVCNGRPRPQHRQRSDCYDHSLR